MTGTLVPVLGDQLSQRLSALRAADMRTDTVLMAEVAEEAGYVGHHKKKIALVFAAMRFPPQGRASRCEGIPRIAR